MSMVLEYGFGAVLACLSALGGIGLTSFLFPKSWRELPKIPLMIGLFYLIETVLYATLSFTYTLFTPLVLFLTWTKVSAGIFMLCRKKVLKLIGLGGMTPIIWLIFLLINASVPTSNFDCFSAHFPIPKLFLEHQGYPIRPDVEYLDALPLSAHLWLIPAFAMKMEGYANMVFPLFSVFLFWTLSIKLRGRLGFLCQILLLSIPEFIRISMDPMVDTATFFIITTASLYLFSKRELSWPSISLMAFAFSIKPTLLPLAPIGFIFLLFKRGTFTQLRPALIWSCISLFVASIWPVKNWIIHGSPIYPYFGSTTPPLIPDSIPAPDTAFLDRFFDYLLVVFADHRFFLSLGWVPLFFLPFLFFMRGRRFWLLMLMVASGFLLTFYMTSFKNRYFFPFILLLLPYVGLLFQKRHSLRVFLFLTVGFNAFCFGPYVAQPLVAILKNQNVESFYTMKYDSYPGYLKINQLPEGKILLIGQGSHWINRPHQIAIPSETHLDFSRLKSIADFESHLKQNRIRHLVVHMTDLQGMANHSDPAYAWKAYMSRITIDWIEKLKSESSIISSISVSHGIELIQFTKPSKPQS